MEAEAETQWREVVTKPTHAALSEREAQHHEQGANLHVRRQEPLAVLAVQIDPQLKKDVLAFVQQSGISPDDFVSAVLHQAVKAPEQHLDGFHTVLSNLLGNHQDTLLSKIAEGEYVKRISSEAAESVAALSR